LIDDLARCIPDHDDRSGLPGPAPQHNATL
jgi:hypothetical protein